MRKHAKERLNVIESRDSLTLSCWLKVFLQNTMAFIALFTLFFFVSLLQYFEDELFITCVSFIDKDAYRVTCSANYMRIDLDRRYYNSSKYKSITLMSPTCKHTLSYDYITLGCIPGRCESEKKETTTEIIYVNAVKLTRNFGSGQISRENDETIRFRCSYKKDAVLNNKASFDPVGKISVSLRK